MFKKIKAALIDFFCFTSHIDDIDQIENSMFSMAETETSYDTESEFGLTDSDEFTNPPNSEDSVSFLTLDYSDNEYDDAEFDSDLSDEPSGNITIIDYMLSMYLIL